MSALPVPSPSEFHLGILMLRTAFPRLLGDIGHPDSFDYPVRYQTVSSASVPRVVNAHIDESVVLDFQHAGQTLIDQGASMLATSCGFVCAIHDRLQSRLSVPLVSSALNVLPSLCDDPARAGPIGILTFDARVLAQIPLGRFQRDHVVIQGLEESREFYPTIREDRTSWCEARVEAEVMAAADALKARAADMTTLVLECTNLSPWRLALSHRLGIEVHDIHTAIRHGRCYGPF
ncbi:aspartate/glutamate racemase family protein [Kushneria marisflavi]|uniref:Uncharacterized protein n=1 Tax=Kushneria marisflavi TaxID=157779 RepID=A0A240UPD8_9GAMM|nr:aspartate/glutamate racemase family protein [Kushneria marisflavi]ART63348.1 hypothetical protein B9H00_09985 [Kushneria marisflavi]RKD84392.1 hypothetical protein C8D96_2450 [Kushneria marisflavi]